jgi:hypothetical protein
MPTTPEPSSTLLIFNPKNHTSSSIIASANWEEFYDAWW